MNEFQRCYMENVYTRVPDAFVRRFGGHMMSNEDFKDVVRFDKTGSHLLGASAEGGRLIYGTIRQFKNLYGIETDENVRAPMNLKLDKDDFTDFCFRPAGKAVLLSMGGTLLVLDLETKKVASPFKGGEASVFCISLENPEHVFVGNCRTGDLKQIDFRAPNAPKSISVVDNTPVPKRKVPSKKTMRAVCNLAEKYVAVGFSTNDGGINVWDLRYVKAKKPAHTLNLTPFNRDTFAVYSMQLDRTQTKLFVSCSDGCIREYCISSGASNPTNFYCGTSTGCIKRSFALSPLTDHFVAPLNDGLGIWDYQDRIELDTSLFTRPNTPSLKTPTKTQSPSRMFLSPRLTGSPSISSPGRKVQQVILNEPKGKLFGLPSAKFQFKPWNEQPSLHCDWSACGRYIVATTETAFTICDSESEWAQKSANNDHLELTSKFSAYAIPINFTFPSYFEKRK